MTGAETCPSEACRTSRRPGEVPHPSPLEETAWSLQASKRASHHQCFSPVATNIKNELHPTPPLFHPAGSWTKDTRYQASAGFVVICLLADVMLLPRMHKLKITLTLASHPVAADDVWSDESCQCAGRRPVPVVPATVDSAAHHLKGTQRAPRPPSRPFSQHCCSAFVSLELR